jgi:hypothetical protein
MESPSFVQELQGKSHMFDHATSLEDILCLAVLIANDNYFEVYTVDEARAKYLESFHGECLECPYHEKCVACFINE